MMTNVSATTISEHPAVRCLLSFLSARDRWERESSRAYDAIDWEKSTEDDLARIRDECRNNIEIIFDRYCEIGAKAKRLRDAGQSFNIRTSNELSEQVISVEERRGSVVVETRETTGARWRFRYELVDTPSGWRIRDDRRYRSDVDLRWKADVL